MKRIILTIALLVAGAVCVSAQDLSVLSKAARMAYDYLSSEGYKPTIDDDEDVLFKAEGYSFYVDNDKSDETYLQIVLPYIMELDEEDKPKTLCELQKTYPDLGEYIKAGKKSGYRSSGQ